MQDHEKGTVGDTDLFVVMLKNANISDSLLISEV